MNKTILLGLALAASVSAANAYHVEKYDGQFGMSLEGAYGIATKDAMPNVAGGNLSIFNYIETGSIVHQISLNGGILAGSHHPSVHDLGISGPYTASLRSTYIPMMAGYTLNLPIGDYTMFYLGGPGRLQVQRVPEHGLRDRLRILPDPGLQRSRLPYHQAGLLVGFLSTLRSSLSPAAPHHAEPSFFALETGQLPSDSRKTRRAPQSRLSQKAAPSGSV